MPSPKQTTASRDTTLIIVESPTKAITISKFVGKGYAVESSYGHLRDLPKSKLGIDVEANFTPHYIIPRKSQKRATALKKIATKAKNIILAPDEDREGEAIAWHIRTILDPEGKAPEKFRRIVFHEITKSAIQEALEHPRDLDMHLVDAQQARRVLDRLVGYKLSPFLWKKIHRGLSAGRVQSVALRLIVEREEEIKKFISQEYYSVQAQLTHRAHPTEPIEAQLTKINGGAIEKPGIIGKDYAQSIVEDLRGASFTIADIERQTVHKNPSAPFTTSTLQQTAAKRLGFSAKKTMVLAQILYENGLITYMRTDSVNIAHEAILAAKHWIQENLGNAYVLPEGRRFKTKSRLAQEAHEAIRPTDISKTPEGAQLAKDEARLYELIWRRFAASQLPPAKVEATRFEIVAQGKEAYTLTSAGAVLLFDGFLKIWPAKFEEKILPAQLAAGDTLAPHEIQTTQHFTQPPARYNEASLIKTLEQYGIGRPSTYAPIISVIQTRDYVEKQQGKFYPTEIGTLVNSVLTQNFPEVVDIQFTATMEDKLDDVAQGKQEWHKVIGEFYDPFSNNLEKKYEEVSKKDLVDEVTDQVCEKCGKPMVIKFGRFGKFLACSGFPECKNTKTLKSPPKPTGVVCPKCTKAELVEKRVSKKGRARGKVFWGCARYPDCDYATWTDPTKPAPLKEGEDKDHEPS